MSKKFDGGYYMIDSEIMRSGIHRHTASAMDGISDKALTTLNVLGMTPKRINRFVFDVMSEAYTNGDYVGGLPSPYDPVIPDRCDDDVWEQMSENERAEHKARREEAHLERVRLASLRKQFLDKLSVAREFYDAERFYEPFFLDFRGRFYPMPENFHSQGDDICKALIMFAEGKPIGQKGLYWLAVRAANCYGEDKLPLDERVEWVMKHLDLIVDSARNPLDGQRFWCDADEPWSFLATCYELEQATAMGDRAPEFVSHLPIPLDGSCNGLQHLSAMSLDPVGAKATNLMDRAEREDIYLEVAAAVRSIMAQDAAAGEAWASDWLAVLTDVSKGRKVVKRAVMTTPYGVTERGIQQQLVKDGHVKLLPRYKEMTKQEKWEAAKYLKDKIVEGLAATISSAKQVMAWIQTCAEVMAEANVPLRWETPNANRVQQSYFNLSRTKVKTLFGEQILWDEDKFAGLNPKKQALASAPNVIHSFDAAHLSKTVNRLAALGYSDFLMIHDSYGVHAADTDVLSKVLREEFVSIYSENWLERLYQGWARDMTGRGEIPHWSDFVQRGGFDINQVLKSVFFFA